MNRLNQAPKDVKHALTYYVPSQEKFKAVFWDGDRFYRITNLEDHVPLSKVLFNTYQHDSTECDLLEPGFIFPIADKLRRPFPLKRAPHWIDLRDLDLVNDAVAIPTDGSSFNLDVDGEDLVLLLWHDVPDHWEFTFQDNHAEVRFKKLEPLRDLQVPGPEIKSPSFPPSPDIPEHVPKKTTKQDRQPRSRRGKGYKGPDGKWYRDYGEYWDSLLTTSNPQAVQEPETKEPLPDRQPTSRKPKSENKVIPFPTRRVGLKRELRSLPSSTSDSMEKQGLKLGERELYRIHFSFCGKGPKDSLHDYSQIGLKQECTYMRERKEDLLRIALEHDIEEIKAMGTSPRSLNNYHATLERLAWLPWKRRGYPSQSARYQGGFVTKRLVAVHEEQRFKYFLDRKYKRGFWSKQK